MQNWKELRTFSLQFMPSAMEPICDVWKGEREREKSGGPLRSNLPSRFLAAFPQDRIFVTKAETEKGLQKTMKRGKKSGRERGLIELASDS